MKNAALQDQKIVNMADLIDNMEGFDGDLEEVWQISNQMFFGLDYNQLKIRDAILKGMDQMQALK